MLVVVWLALIVYTFLDARRRVSDPFLVACATIASFIPYIGTAVYAILRPPEFLEDAHERELEIRAAELRVRQLTESSCPQVRVPDREELPALPQLPAPAQEPVPELRQARRSALGPVPLLRDALEGRSAAARRRSAAHRRERAPAPAARPRGAPGAKRRARAAARKRRTAAKQEPAGAPPSQGPPPNQRPKRSTSREPDPDPRQA